jgi:hypothetical protein
MVLVVERMEQTTRLLAAPRAIALVSVPWSPWPQKSRKVLAVLEESRELWLPAVAVEFFDLWPERDAGLNSWYDRLCESHSQFELHGHGYGPLWWLAGGKMLACRSKPYESPIEDLRGYSALLLRAGNNSA